MWHLPANSEWRKHGCRLHGVTPFRCRGGMAPMEEYITAGWNLSGPDWSLPLLCGNYKCTQNHL